MTGPGTYDLRPGCSVRSGARLYVGPGARLTVMPGVSIGDRTVINVAESVWVGEGTQISWDCQILDTDFHKIRWADGHGRPSTAPVRLGARVLVSTGTIITKGVQVGDEAVIGAGSVVTSREPFPPRVLIAGNPAAVRAQIDGWEP